MHPDAELRDNTCQINEVANDKEQRTKKRAYKVTTKRKHCDAVADNLLNQNFNPVVPNQVWAGDVTYLKQVKAGKRL
nr:hypothetical protein BCU22_09675 [Vibrio cyclitrophicus]